MIIKASITELLRLVTGRRRGKKVTAAQQSLQTNGGAHILIAKTAYERMLKQLTSREPEMGGVLIGPRGHPSVTHFVLDETGRGSAASFTFDHIRLNEIVREYVRLELDVKGFGHSHPSGYRHLSQGDLAYVRKLFLNPKNDVEEVFMPIVVDGQVYPYIVQKSQPERPLKAQLVLF